MAEGSHENYNDKQVAVWNLKPVNQNYEADDWEDDSTFFIENLLVNGSNHMPRLKS